MKDHDCKNGQEHGCEVCEEQMERAEEIRDELREDGVSINEIEKWQEYQTNCLFCGNKFTTTKGSANEGICEKCREA